MTRCSICNHSHSAAIDTALATGGKLIATAANFGVSKSALHRHQRRCTERALAYAGNVDAFLFSSRPIPASVAPADAPRVCLSGELLEAMCPLEKAEDAIGEMLETKLRHLNAIYAYALSRGVAKDDVTSILRAGRAMQRLFELDLVTAPQRLRYQAEQAVDPIMKMLATILDSAHTSQNTNGTRDFATRCNEATELGRHRYRYGGQYA